MIANKSALYPWSSDDQGQWRLAGFKVEWRPAPGCRRRDRQLPVPYRSQGDFLSHVRSLIKEFWKRVLEGYRR